MNSYTLDNTTSPIYSCNTCNRSIFILMILFLCLVSMSSYALSDYEADGKQANTNRISLCNKVKDCSALMVDKSKCHDNSGVRYFYPAVDTQSEFVAFAEKFYCALKTNEYKEYIERIKFPLPYISNNTEGQQSGAMTKDDFEGWYISAGDGYELTPTYNVSQSKASVSVEWLGTGMGRVWNFSLINGKWMLVSVVMNDY